MYSNTSKTHCRVDLRLLACPILFPKHSTMPLMGQRIKRKPPYKKYLTTWDISLASLTVLKSHLWKKRKAEQKLILFSLLIMKGILAKKPDLSLLKRKNMRDFTELEVMTMEKY